MKHMLIVAGYGIAGLLVALALTAGAFAVAGSDIARPASPVGGLATPATAPLAPTPSPHEDANTDDHHASPSPSASIDDQGGGSGSDSGTDGDSGGSDDGSSSGSGSDNSGDGSGSDD